MLNFADLYSVNILFRLPLLLLFSILSLFAFCHSGRVFPWLCETSHFQMSLCSGKRPRWNGLSVKCLWCSTLCTFFCVWVQFVCICTLCKAMFQVLWRKLRLWESRQSGHWLLSRTAFISIQQWDVTHWCTHMHAHTHKITDNYRQAEECSDRVSSQLSLPHKDSLFVPCLFELNIVSLLFYIHTDTHKCTQNPCCSGRNAWCNSRAIPPYVPWEKGGVEGLQKRKRCIGQQEKTRGDWVGRKSDWLTEEREEGTKWKREGDSISYKGGKKEREKGRERLIEMQRWLG